MAQAKRKEPEVASETKAAAATATLEQAEGTLVPFERPAPMSRRAWVVLGLVVVAFNAPLLHYYLLRGEQPVTATVPFFDDYSSYDTVAKNYWSTGGMWRTVGGMLLSPGVKNNPLWLKARLPDNVAVEFDAKSESPEGDVKCEIFGDGSDHASGYVLIHGGWNNAISIIARRDEHGVSAAQLQENSRRLAVEQGKPGATWVETGTFKADTRMRVEMNPNPIPVQLGRIYHWRIERRGSLLTWFIDGQKFMEFDDPFPLKGKGHDRFGFSSWESQLSFDNLKIEPL